MKARIALVTVALALALSPMPPVLGAADEPAYRLAFGDVHNHTRYSDGWEGTPADAFIHARASGADYLATSDHNFMLTQDEWDRTKRQAERQTDDDFAALAASEYWIANGFGEVIVLNREGIRTRANWRGPRVSLSRHEVIADFYDWLAAQDGALGHWPHPGFYGDLDRLGHYSPSRDSAMSSIEIHNYGSWLGAPAKWGVHDYEDWYVLALDKGWHVMPAAVSDTHSPDWISGSPVRTVLLTESLAPDEVYDALRSSRGYATLDENLEVRYTLDGAVMGSILRPRDTSYIASIEIRDPDGIPSDEITLVEIVSDHGEVVARRTTGGTDISMSIRLSSTTSRYYYLRVTTASDVTGGEGVTAWTAPVWTGR
jgi:trimeric autotransporter adhesin